jgi:hypothetical protein
LDHGLEALIGFACAHGDALELFEFAEEIFDQVAPLVDLQVDIERLGPTWMLGDDDLRAALGQVGDDGVGIESLVSDQTAKLDILYQWRNADSIEALARQENKPHEVAQRIGQRQDFGRQTASRLTNSLALSPPFAP